MAREGRSPNHVNKPAPPPPLVSLCLHTHYEKNGYYSQHYHVVEMCVKSMRAGAQGVLTELIIWDNGSTPEFREFLREELRPDYLVEAPNIGPHNARRALAGMARGHYVNLTDDDILYRPGWLDAMLKIYETFPNVAVVSGSPINAEFYRDFSPVHKFAERPGVKKVTGHNLLPAQWQVDWCHSIGAQVTERQNFQQTYIEYNGVKVWAMAHHMQMLMPRSVAVEFMRPTKNIVDFWDIAKEISRAGYLQLTTADRTAVHIGNRIDESVVRIRQEWKMK